jgi:hypothetical protein
VVTGAGFLLALFFAPLAGVVPAQATAPALIVVGYLMSRVVREIPSGFEGFPAPDLTMMAFTYSITSIGPVSSATASSSSSAAGGGGAPMMLRSRCLRDLFALLLISAASSAEPPGRAWAR